MGEYEAAHGKKDRHGEVLPGDGQQQWGCGQRHVPRGVALSGIASVEGEIERYYCVAKHHVESSEATEPIEMFKAWLHTNLCSRSAQLGASQRCQRYV